MKWKWGSEKLKKNKTNKRRRRTEWGIAFTAKSGDKRIG
jgi:hypothetical protein